MSTNEADEARKAEKPRKERALSSKTSGPSVVGKVVAVISVLLCMGLVVAPISLWISIPVLLLWLGWGADGVMMLGGLSFWEDGGVAEIGTVFFGCLWWVALTGVLRASYIPWGWTLGLLLAVLTAVVINKIARHWGATPIFLLSLLLGWGILWLNQLAIIWNAPLATEALTGYSSSGCFSLVLISALIMTFFAVLARYDYSGDDHNYNPATEE